MPSHRTQLAEKYSKWFAKRGPQLWSLVSFQAADSLDLREDFEESMRAAFFRLRTKSKIAEPDAFTRLFLREWSNCHRPYQSEWRWEEKLLLFGLFRFGWSLEELSYYTGRSISSLRLRTFEALKKLARVTHAEAQQKGRDCARFDLFIIDVLLNHAWTDPLGLFSREALLQHQQGCARCQPLRQKFDESIKHIRSVALAPLPPELEESLQFGHESSSAWVAKNWLSKWPWYFKVPFQVTLAALVIFCILAVPYVGDLFPSHTKKEPGILDRISQMAKNANKELPSTAALPPPPAPVFVAAKKVPAPLPPSTAANPVPAPAAKASPPKSAPAATVSSAPPPPAVVPNPLVKSVAVAASPAPAKEAPVTDAKSLARLLFRWGATSSDLDRDRDRVMVLLKKYDATQAGELALGASNHGGRYFHFSVPQSNFNQLMEDVKKLGLENFTSTQSISPRKTPIDRRRIVFFVAPVRRKTDGRPEGATSSELGDEAQPSAPGSP